MINGSRGGLWPLVLAVSLSGGLAACSGSSGTTGSSTAASGTSSGTTGQATGAVSTGAGPTTSASSSTSTTTGATTGATTGPTTGSTSGASTTAAATSGTSGGSTTGSLSGPYQPYDGGPHSEQLPLGGDAGCTIGAPFPVSQGCAQCRGDSDCPAPLICSAANGTGQCVQCDAMHPFCGSGLICDVNASQTCIVNCLLTPGVCVGQFGGICDADAGFGPAGDCASGMCFSVADCPSALPYCSGQQCVQCDPVAGSGCGDGFICSTESGQPQCAFDCRTDAGVCRPGVCDFDAGSPGVCESDICNSDADCADSFTPNCVTGACVQCTTDLGCATLGVGTPFCVDNQCTASCTGACGGGLQCESIDAGFQLQSQCVCASDSDCAQQSAAPTCLPLDALAGLDAGAGAYGICGCVAGACPSGTVCESRPDVLALVSPHPYQSPPLCIANCATGTLNCGLDQGFPPNAICNPNTGYCVGCYDDAQCAPAAADAGTPNCVPIDAGVPAGGGRCGCASTASCSDGDACVLQFQATTPVCAAPCTFSSTGDDSCLYQRSSGLPGLCNTETGACQQCVTNKDCEGQTAFNFPYPEPFCSDGGACIGCLVPNDCPLQVPGCIAGACGACNTTADCPSGDGGAWVCVANVCGETCTASGDECATNPVAPFCNTVTSTCEQCRVDDDCDLDAGFSHCISGVCHY